MSLVPHPPYKEPISSPHGFDWDRYSTSQSLAQCSSAGLSLGLLSKAERPVRLCWWSEAQKESCAPLLRSHVKSAAILPALCCWDSSMTFSYYPWYYFFVSFHSFQVWIAFELCHSSDTVESVQIPPFAPFVAVTSSISCALCFPWSSAMAPCSARLLCSHICVFSLLLGNRRCCMCAVTRLAVIVQSLDHLLCQSYLAALTCCNTFWEVWCRMVVFLAGLTWFCSPGCTTV